VPDTPYRIGIDQTELRAARHRKLQYIAKNTSPTIHPYTMSERGAFRGRGGGRGGGDRGGRGGGRGGAQAGGAAGQTERPKKENILDLNKYMDKRITVKFSGGREGMRDVVEGGMTSRGQWKSIPS
jgi:hypothetical protein